MLNLLRQTVSGILKGSAVIFRYRKVYLRYKGYTMIPENEFISNIALVNKFRSVKGAVVECGVWRGGMSAGIADILGKERNYFLFDSFEGLPPAKDIDGEGAISWQQDITSPGYFENCKAEKEWAEKAMQLSGATKYQLVKGWFDSTLPGFNFKESIAILRLDGDWYDSTMSCLVNLYPKVAKGGVIIFDDYYTWDGCSRALHDYLSANSLQDKIYYLTESACYIIKTN